MDIKKRIAALEKYIDSHLWALILGIALLILVQILAQFLMGRLFICKCGYVLLWYNNTNGAGNSQHLFDWYSFSHIIHGILIYAFLWLVARRLPVRTRFLLAVLIECSWEIFENTPLIVTRYSHLTFAFDYYGDSIINSVSDTILMFLGFFMARKFPVWLSVTAVIALEVLTLAVVRDSFTLNLITLIHPIESVKNWQAAAPNMTNMSFYLFRGG